MKFLLKTIVLVLTIQSCATFHPEFSIVKELKRSDLSIINGQYEIHSSNTETTIKMYNEYKCHETFIEEIERDAFDRSNSNYSQDSSEFMLEIEVKDENLLEFTLLKHNNLIKSKSIKFLLKDDGYLYLKNKNVKCWGIPYLFGVIDINKIRISLDSENNLLLDVTNFHGGALFLIGFLDGGKTVYRKRMNRIVSNKVGK